jgi:TolB protein
MRKLALLGALAVFALLAACSGDGGEGKEVTPAAEEELTPVADKIAFMSDRDDNDEVYVMNADGSGQTRLTKSPGADSGPVWSP